MHSQQRIQWIDIARALAMFLVFFGHLGETWFPLLQPALDAIYTFHMPLFFLLSGLFFKPGVRLSDLARKRARTLLIPYYVFSVLALISPVVKLLQPSLYAEAGKSTTTNPLHEILSIVLSQGNSGLWFLWSLFVALLALWLILRLTKGNRIAQLIVLLLCLATDYATAGAVWRDTMPFQLGRIFEATAYVGLGHLIAQTFDIRSWDHIPVIQKVACFAAGLLAFLSLEFITVTHPVCTSPASWPLVFLTTLAGIATSISASLLIPEYEWLSVIGRDSLVFYALNDIALKVVKFGLFSVIKLPIATMNLPLELAVGLFIVILAMGICYASNFFIQRHMRWSIGG
ncbi:acyltransferase family protein [Bifidobacterium oedipodis]|uniref:Acyltransferase n=1 Tax=Bifidobacterium oedipodis TaxID=2675322 RepID=A0A7Y0ERS2_9BIFI|nr:acyltransferase family protein [Bifidobacterium sp. DSM 109957]NMM95243.1 acyltransferase [Bifidobacterium sp. DSM 109957]